MDNLNHHTSPLFLTKGSQVEVSSDEDGFDGAWYVATVIHPPPSLSSSPNPRTRNNLVYVEYHDLLAEHGSSRRLREYANISYVRPSPPLSDPNATSFQLNDVVDAFHRDGWWTGVITAVIDSVNFVVTFANPPEQIQFRCSDLRIHRKWDGARWFQPQKQGTAGLMFTVGKKVEVCFDRESLSGCWLPATILKNLDNDTFLVEYQQPGTGDEVVLHKVTVDYVHIRPSPPHLRDKNFSLLEKVDAYYDFGWWSGVITKKLADNRYNVFFKHAKKEREFIYSEVRPHMEWKGGKWFNASQADTDGKTTHSLIEQIEETTPCISEQSIMKKTRQEDLDSNDNGSPPLKKPQDEIMKDDLRKKPNCPSVGSSEGFESEVTGMTDQAFSKTEILSGGKKVPSKLGKGVEAKTPTTDSSRKRGELTNEHKSLQASVEGSKVDSIKTRTLEIVGEKDITIDDTLPVVMGLQCKGMKVTQGKMLDKQSVKNNPKVTESDTQQPSVPDSSLAVARKEGNEGDAASVTPKRKRGRPPKLQALIPDNQNGGVIPSALSVVKGGQKRDNKGPVKEQFRIQNAPLSKGKLVNETTELDVDVQLGQGTKKYSAKKEKRVKRRTISINTESSAQDSEDTSKEKTDGRLEKDSATRNPEASLGKLLDTVSDDQPLCRYLEAKHAPITVHGSEGSVEQSSKVIERPVTCDMDSKDVTFVRSTSLWKTIESMEAFRLLPQKPHFRPLLEGVKETSREGLAIGTMVTFLNMVDKTCGLRFNDPRSTIEDCLETLVELENNGFDVEVIRKRLTQLLLIKNRHEDLAERSKGAIEKLKEHHVQGKRNDEEIEAIDRQIRELQEKRKQLVLNKEKRNSEIGSMESMNEEIEQEISKAGAEFDGLAAAPLLSI